MRILCLLICLVTMGCGACDDYYVDIDAIGGACDDAGPGSIDEPWQTLGRIMADQEPRPGPGDTVWIRGGVYDHSLILTRGGEEGLPLTVSAYQDETPVIDGGGTLPRGVVFSDGGSADHIVLDGLTVRNLADGGVGIMISGRTDVTIQNADVSGARMGVWPGACSNVQIRDSEIHHNSNGNIYLDSRNVDIVIADCHIHHTEKAHNISVYAPGNAVRTSGLPVGLDINDGVATFGIEGVDLSKVRRGTLTGQDAEGSVPCPAVVLLFPDENPIPNGLPLPGGSIRLPDGRDWYAMRAVPEWDGKPYSQDGTLGQFYIGDADPNTILQAKHIFVTYLFPDDVANRDIQILRNEIHHAYTQGIWVQRAEGVLIEGNTTHHNGASGIQIESLSRRIWIEDNTSYANGLHHNHETGMWIDETIDAVVQGNTCYENQKAMGITQCEWVIARRNFLYNNRAQHCGGDPAGCRRNAGAFWFNGGRHNNLGAPPGAQNNALVHNTMWGNGTQESVWGGIQHGINGYPRVGSNAIINNLVQNCLGAAPIFISALPGALDGNLYAAAGPFTAFIA
ncbi:MAG TPA: right-handed parallel beta-helix repeat-containing protein, partial [Armatimonadota bacterium]|nr:right-handed parallel beta-helix repeat-containing protein [Armatimonadota bacterium]